MQLEYHSLPRGLRWLCLSLFLRSGLSAAVTDPRCSCRDYGSCIFNTDVSPSLPIKRNVAVGKTAKMSSVFNSTKHKEISGPACLAVNGKTDTIFRPVNQFPDSPNCIHTGDGDRDPYWEVDLGQPYSINSITVYWRSLRRQVRSDGVNITVDGKLCYTFRRPVLNPSDITCSTQLAGQTVRLAKNDHSTDADYHLNVCEVEVWESYSRDPTEAATTTTTEKSNSSDQTEVPTTPATMAAATSCSPATCDITKLMFPVVGAVLAGSVVIGICIAAVLWLRRSRDRRLGLTAEARGAGGMVTELGDVGRSEVRAQSSGLHDNQTQGDYVNLHDVRDVKVQWRKENKYLAFSTRKSDKSCLISDLSDDEEHEEMK